MTGYGATFTIVNNPDTAGNSSSKVAKIVKVNVNDLGRREDYFGILAGL